MKRIAFPLMLSCLFVAMLLLASCGAKEQPPPAGSASSTPAPAGDQAATPENPDARPAPAGEVATPETPAESPEPAKPVPAVTKPAQPEPMRAPTRDPNIFVVRFETSKGDIDIECHTDWAPLGAARFRELVESGYYDGARFFRVVPGFVVQFGIAGNPLLTAKWKNANLRDDAVLQSNTRGMLSFATAGPNTRTTQIFINLGDNQRLDGMGFSPFGKVIRGMDAVDAIDSRYGEQPQQPRIEDEGEAYLQAEFPHLDKIIRARVLP
jgi:peptidyl-prolyl cis-trans isomerase A (cyclophilin A)